MLVNDEIMNELYYDAGSERVQRARIYVRTGRVEIQKINYDYFLSVRKIFRKPVYPDISLFIIDAQSGYRQAVFVKFCKYLW